jgi:hypothetical protein
MLAATEKVAEPRVTARESFWRSVIEVPPARRAAVRGNVTVTTKVQNYSIVVGSRHERVAARTAALATLGG